MNSKFTGLVAVVTGAAKGIGFACAQSLGERGAKVVVADCDADAAKEAVNQLQKAGITCTSIEVDVSSKDQVDEMIRNAVSAFGSVDIAVANAGIVKVAPFLEMSEEDWDSVIDVNLKGVFLTCQAAARQMVEQNRLSPGKGGAIITMSSVNGVTAIPTIAAYNASKGGIENLTRCMALSLAEHNIRVNAIGPGSIMTEVLQAVADDKQKMAAILSRTPMGRPGEPREIGEICQFLASSESSYITGQTIYADGGRLALNYTVPVPPEYQ
uniref:Glucose 1-dehydrogenase n=1 Tax=Tetraselmis sp. GSL018 TaxID=582737 RepID=A0A061R3V6_9CHLO|mmetsp:Transcript_5393/g.13121  ORF Transcript_5393/g.13121 Transcript_5393/m.13121 type:complete len:269 (-) Transcript_5393:119-925(-)|eukprot:CAMPEP_0177599768 /NCGR_PEP_ID=MMETSP0419_2-20121207/13196_1 /TAXON_ID=582737 /ORGANISM="Tetraselmis sp., Strain GSL018" /LENGTH=268 /DNA_ID=CAMNT_0019092577 /DNA_START=186 /DNA_END=992 /DNA_ORIENTATION=+